MTRVKRAHAWVGGHKRLQLRRHPGARQTQAQGAMLKLEVRHAGGIDGLRDVAPGLLGALAQGRSAGLAATEEAACCIGHHGARAGAAAVNANPVPHGTTAGAGSQE